MHLAHQASLRQEKRHHFLCALSWLTKPPKKLYILLNLLLVPLCLACQPITSSDSSDGSLSSQKPAQLTLWWEKGYTIEEDEALRALVNDWEKTSGNTVKLSFYTLEELPQKVRRAVQAGHPPDLMMSQIADRILNPRLAWEGKLADVTDVLQPVAHRYNPAILDNVYFYNRAAQKHSYYAVPISQATIHIFYWQDLLAQANRTPEDIPQDWHGFWQFWQQVQDELQSQQQDIYGLGFPLSGTADDTEFLFEQILEAYDVKIVNTFGQLQVDQPQVRQGITNALNWFTQFYRQGYIPPTALNWSNIDNNRNLLNRVVVMTPNITLSIPSAIRQDANTYEHQLGTLEFPRKPSGEPMRYLLALRQVVLFADSPHQDIGKEFLRYLTEPDTIANYLQACGGRNLPVLKSVWQEPYWADTQDPHIAKLTKTLTTGETRPFALAANPAYSEVLQTHVWGEAIHKIVVEGKSPEQATAEAIERIEQIFARWE